MLNTVKWLACVAIVIAWSETEAYPSVWKRDVPLFAADTIAGNAVREDPSAPGVCNSEICQRDAKNILESLDLSVDPCDDFYMFTCGGWKEKHPPTNDTEGLSIDGELKKKMDNQMKLMLEEPISEDDISPLKAAKKFYQVCMDVETIERAGIQPLVDLSNELGGWPMALEHWSEDNFTVESTLADFQRVLNWSPLFRVHSSISGNDTSRRYLLFSGRSRMLARLDTLAPDYEEKLELLERTIANQTFQIMNATGVDIDEESVLLEASRMVEFMLQLNNLTSENQTSKELTLKEFQEWIDPAFVVNAYAEFNWLRYLNKILSDTDIVLDEDEVVIVEDMDYWIRLLELLDYTAPRDIANFLQWNFINTFRGEIEMRIKYPIPDDENLTRSVHCLEVTRERFNHAINSKLVPNIYTEDDKPHFNILAENLRSELIHRMSNVTWLDDESRAMVIERLETMKAYSGYPDLYNNASALLDYYGQVNVSSVHFLNMMRVDIAQDYEKSVPFLRHPIYQEDDEWSFSPELPMAMYDPDSNFLVISFGHLPSFYFKVGRLRAMEYGRLGAIVGHEMMHGVSTLYGEDWTSNTTAIFYDDQCFIDQYDRFPVLELEQTGDSNITVNGTKTLAENIGDNYGLATAYEACVRHHGTEQRLPGLEEYSTDQLFYISWGMSWCESRTNESMIDNYGGVHSPGHARVRGTVSNLDHFASAFNCPAGSNMNPVNKCRMWGPEL